MLFECMDRTENRRSEDESRRVRRINEACAFNYEEGTKSGERRKRRRSVNYRSACGVPSNYHTNTELEQTQCVAAYDSVFDLTLHMHRVNLLVDSA